MAIDIVDHLEILDVKMNEAEFKIFWNSRIKNLPHMVPVVITGYGIMINHIIEFFFGDFIKFPSVFSMGKDVVIINFVILFHYLLSPFAA